jgi:hypothetical protein
MAESKLGIGSKITHPKFGLGVIVNLDSKFYKIYFSTLDEVKQIDRSYENLEVNERAALEVEPIDIRDIEKAVENVLLKYSDLAKVIPLGNKWMGGTLTIKPGSPDLQSKEIPIRTFFHKIVMVRDRLRVLEQNINSNEKLDDEDKIHMQQYITRAYGSLTTFNVLFADKNDQFKGAGKED